MNSIRRICLASVAATALLAVLASASWSSPTRNRAVAGQSGRVWPVALTGLRDVAPLFCETAGCGVGSTATSASYRGVSLPFIEIGPHGDLYIADSYGSQPIRVVGIDGRIKRVFHPRAPVGRLAVASDGTIAYSDRGTPTVIREISPSGSERILAGDRPSGSDKAGEYCECGDGGPARRGRFVDVNDIAFDRQQRLVIADTGHHRIRRIAKDGNVETIVGVGVPCAKNPPEKPCSPPGTPATTAEIYEPIALAFGPDGTLWFTHLRYAEPEQVLHISTDGLLEFAAEAGSLKTQFNQLSVTPDGQPVTFVTGDGKRPHLVSIDPTSSKLKTILGAAASSGCLRQAVALTCGDGLSGLSASLDSTTGTFAADRFGGIYVATIGNEVRYLPPPGGPAQRLGLAVSAAYPIELHRGQAVRVRYWVSTPDARITARLARKVGTRPRIYVVQVRRSGARSGSIAWNAMASGRRLPAGSYVLQIEARSRGRIATRQVVVGIKS